MSPKNPLNSDTVFGIGHRIAALESYLHLLPLHELIPSAPSNEFILAQTHISFYLRRVYCHAVHLTPFPDV